MTAFYFVRSKEIGKGCSKRPSNNVGNPEGQHCAEFECEVGKRWKKEQNSKNNSRI